MSWAFSNDVSPSVARLGGVWLGLARSGAVSQGWARQGLMISARRAPALPAGFFVIQLLHGWVGLARAR